MNTEKISPLKFAREELPRETPYGNRKFRWFPVVGDFIDMRGPGYPSKKAALAEAEGKSSEVSR